MKQYEMLCVLPGTLSESEITPITDSVKAALETHEAKNLTMTDLGKSRLAYPIKHIRYGYFVLFLFDLDPTNFQKLERTVRLLGTMLRVVTKIRDPKNTTTVSLAVDPTALSAPQKEESRGRDRGGFKSVVKKENDVREESATEVVPAKGTDLNLENIDEKLDEILQKDIDKV